jgi:MoxR-like ATPase
MVSVRARALMEGRYAPSVEDIRAMAPAVLIHRMALGFAARAEGHDLAALLAREIDLVLDHAA